MSGCQIKSNGLIKLGILLLDQGDLNNDQIIAEEYIADVIRLSPQFNGYGMYI